MQNKYSYFHFKTSQKVELVGMENKNNAIVFISKCHISYIVKPLEFVSNYQVTFIIHHCLNEAVYIWCKTRTSFRFLNNMHMFGDKSNISVTCLPPCCEVLENA